jgi:hypothetical protein
MESIIHASLLWCNHIRLHHDMESSIPHIHIILYSHIVKIMYHASTHPYSNYFQCQYLWSSIPLVSICDHLFLSSVFVIIYSSRQYLSSSILLVSICDHLFLSSVFVIIYYFRQYLFVIIYSSRLFLSSSIPLVCIYHHLFLSSVFVIIYTSRLYLSSSIPLVCICRHLFLSSVFVITYSSRQYLSSSILLVSICDHLFLSSVFVIIYSSRQYLWSYIPLVSICDHLFPLVHLSIVFCCSILYIFFLNNLYVVFKEEIYYTRNVLTVPLMYFRQIGHFRMAGAQSLQHTIWPHGRNAMDASKSRQTLQRRWSFNCLFSSRRDSVSENIKCNIVR